MGCVPLCNGKIAPTPFELVLARGDELADARLHLGQLGGSLVLQAAPRAIRTAVGEWGPPPAAFPVMQKMKERFDPLHRLNPGRYVGGI